VHVPPTTTALPPRLAATLKRAFAAERAATGASRRPAFRATRYLLGAAFARGIDPVDVAALAGLVADSLRTRAANADGIIPPKQFAALAQISERRITRWASEGLLPPMSTDQGGTTGYPARALVHALLTPVDRRV
jgi:hypothetical protein